jgi:DNA-directed RNA polymerase specialized sigma24 family protein
VNIVRRRQRRDALEQRVLRRHNAVPAVPGPAGELWALVAALPGRQRTAVVLRHVGHLGEREIADVMGVRRSTVSSALRDAYAALRVVLSESPQDAEEVRHG